MPDITNLLKDFYDFLVVGVGEYLFVFNLHYILAYITLIIGIRYTKNLDWYKQLWGKKLKRFVIPITGFILVLGYVMNSLGDLNGEYISSLVQSFIITISLQDIFIVLFGFLMSALTLNRIKFDHKERSIVYVVTKKTYDKIELSENKDDIENDSKSLDN